MDRLIYTALSGMNSAMDRQRAISSNLANTSTPGFRAESFSTMAMHVVGDTFDVRGMAQGSVRGADMSPSQINPTGRALDVALRGDALMAVQTADGGEGYTRRGDLTVEVSGRLINGDGLPVMGEGGPIVVPPGWNVSIGTDGSVLATDPAAPGAPAEEVGRIKLANPAGSAVIKGLDGQLRVPDGGVLPADPTAELSIGALEQSNVNTGDTLVEMIEAQRGFERRAKLISTADQLDQASARLMSLS